MRSRFIQKSRVKGIEGNGIHGKKGSLFFYREVYRVKGIKGDLHRRG